MTISGLLGRKVGMTTVYREDGTFQGVTVIETGPCVITQVKTKPRDGYEAVQIGFGLAKNLSKPEIGHLERSKGKFRHLQEFTVKDLGEFEVGKTLKADVFQAGEIVRVIGRSKGRGFQGGVKRHHFRGGPKTHGQSDRLRGPGAIGSTTHPGHVWKGTRMAGHMGDDRATVTGLEIIKADAEKNLLLVKGAVPGTNNGIVRIEKTGKVKRRPPPPAPKKGAPERRPAAAKPAAAAAAKPAAAAPAAKPEAKK
jgi:large subunit ribosomal protein L3